MSLLTCASPWESNESKKRISSMRKTQKKMPTLDEIQITEVNSINEERPSSFEEDQNSINQRSDRVNELINNMSNVLQENDGGKLADFKPVPMPEMQKKTD